MHTSSSPAPLGQPDPAITNISATSLHLSWESPNQPNGIISNYLVHRRTPSLLSSPAHNDVGVSFTGNGYATFAPPNPSNFSNEISLRFRTLDCCGVLFYSINTAETDMLAVELRNGIPWFVFDAGTGSAAIRPEANETFNDGLWHTLRATQRGNSGTITIDTVYTGSGTSLGSSTVVGYSVYHVGGIPSDAPLRTLNGGADSSAVLSGQSFVGCLYDVVINGVALDFSPGFAGVGRLDQGCPIYLVPTVQLLGGGYFSLVDDIITGSSYNMSFYFRTTHTDGLLLYMSANSSFLFGIELRNSILHYMFSDRAITLTIPCDGEWHHVSITQGESSFLFTVDDLSQSFALDSDSTVLAPSRIFFGGLPRDSIEFTVAQDAGFDVYTPFSGCIRIPEPLLYVAGQPISGSISESEHVNFDGCGNAPGPSCTAPWFEIDAEMARNITDSELNPFSGI